jgi:hypothetical protein
LPAREDIIDQALELLIVDLIELELPRNELLYEVPVQEGKAVVDDMSIEGEGVPFFAVAIVYCKELRVNLKSNILLLHQAELLIDLVLPLQTFKNVVLVSLRLIIVVMVFRAPQALVQGDGVKH